MILKLKHSNFKKFTMMLIYFSITIAEKIKGFRIQIVTKLYELYKLCNFTKKNILKKKCVCFRISFTLSKIGFSSLLIFFEKKSFRK